VLMQFIPTFWIVAIPHISVSLRVAEPQTVAPPLLPEPRA
jgi:hypothetical protein